MLLILAGVALSALTGDSGILNNAESAKDKTNLANAKEQVALAAQGALAKGHAEGSGTITRGNLKIELDNIVGVMGKDYTLSEGEAPWTVKVGEYETLVYSNGKIEQEDLTTLPTATGTTPWLPDGFKKVAGTTLENGLTITNKTGLRNYVWIEVPTTIEKQIKVTVDGVSTTETVKLSDAANDEEIEAVLEAYAGNYTKGDSSQYYSSWKDEWYDSKGQVFSSSTNLEDTAGCGMTYEQYQTAHSNMLNSIKKYGGFWLAQYEAGIAYEQGNRNSLSDRIETPTSANYAKEQYPYNYVYCSEAQKIANADSTSSYTSSLPFGIQWDLVCKFLEVKTNLEYADIATESYWGNYFNVGWTSSTDGKYSDDGGESFKPGSTEKDEDDYMSILLTTGAIDETSYESNKYIANPMNIYDFAGNLDEWTLEYTIWR